LQGCIALPRFHEAAIFLKLFLVEEQSIRRLLDVMSETNSCKGFSCIDFNDNLFEIVMDLEQECGE
jgi:hypothetical protein